MIKIKQRRNDKFEDFTEAQKIGFTEVAKKISKIKREYEFYAKETGIPEDEIPEILRNYELIILNNNVMYLLTKINELIDLIKSQSSITEDKKQ